MVKLRQTMVNGFGVATLCIFLAIVVGNVQVLQAGLAPWPGIGTIALATAAFVVSWKQNSLGMTVDCRWCNWYYSRCEKY